MKDEITTVELMRPLLPEAKHILPYLERIDKSRWYSNFGPLVRELQDRFAGIFKLDSESIVTTSSATAGLTSVLRALGRPRDSYCLVPAWTFVATPASAIAAEMIPYFLDVDDQSWALNAETVKKSIKNIKGVVGAVIVVAPFGKAIDVREWDKFTADTSIPVIIDAAAAFDAFKDSTFGSTPVVFSLHATKALGVGEGGLVVSRDKALIRHVQEITNFGFYTRQISFPGVNSKMSEYTAAVSHAALDDWPNKRQKWLAVTHKYQQALAPVAKKHNLTVWLQDDVISSTCNIRLPQGNADAVISLLQRNGVKARQWWDKGCHCQPAYRSYPRDELTVTNNLAASLVSLPFYVDIPDAHITYSVDHLTEILDNQ